MKLSRVICAVVIMASFCGVGFAGDHRIGGGVHYWKTIDELKEDHKKIDDDGLSYIVSYQYAPATLMKFEIDAEFFPDGFQGAEDFAISPQGYVIVGMAIYAGLGGGITYADDLDDKFSDPFFAAKAGLDLPLLPGIHLDVNANYKFTEWENWSDLNTDTITLGGQVRIEF